MERPSFDVVIHEEEVKGKSVFVADCETLGISDFGKTLDEAISNLRKAVSLYLEECPEDKKLLRKETPVLTTRIFL